MPTSRDLFNRSAVSTAFTTAVISSDTTTAGPGINVSDKSSLLFTFHAGVYTDGTYTPNIQDSDDNSTFADIDDDHLIGTEAAAALTTNGVSSIGAHTFKKWVRARIVSASTTTGATIGSVLTATKS